jgi:hypothetical protein
MCDMLMSRRNYGAGLASSDATKGSHRATAVSFLAMDDCISIKGYQKHLRFLPLCLSLRTATLYSGSYLATAISSFMTQGVLELGGRQGFAKPACGEG